MFLSASSIMGAVLSSAEVNAVADAIFKSEHSRTHPYGVMLRTKDPRLVCMNTIRHAWVDFTNDATVTGKSGVMIFTTKSTLPASFVPFLGHRYCPPSVDPVGYTNWCHNVTWFLTHDH